jgi:hypothetical protein
VVLNNASSSEKEITTVGCSYPGLSLRVDPGKVRQMTLISSTDSTLLLRGRRQECFIVCWQTAMADVATFSPTAFWSLFGGRKIEIRWVGP